MKSELRQKVEEIFQSALDRPLEQRAAYLEQACGDDAELRREVESMVSSFERAGSFIERPALEVDAQVLAGATPDSLVGRSAGHYKVLEKIGAGGMGEVYVAEDSRLGRRVALKLLSPYLARDQEGVRRFQQEARAASTLNHPNVLTVYDTGAHDGSPYVVSELLEGATLRERMNCNALSQRKAIDYALQIARGLAAAHERNIVHRDIKPENIFVTTDGRVKILDFGIAKLTEKREGAPDTEAPTRAFVQTSPGMVIGTAGYMSPEQARGTKTDHRSDIFSFGAVLYEMLTGRRAFRGDSPVETRNAILNEDAPDLRTLNPDVSPALERAVLRCLEKNPSARFQSVSDLAFALEALSMSSVSGATLPTAATTRDKTRERLIWIAVSSLLLLAAVSLAVFLFRRGPAEKPPAAVRFLIPATEKLNFRGPPVLSPDGQFLVFDGRTPDGKGLLWVRRLGMLDAQPLPGTEGGIQPFWSPDNRSIGFFARGQLKKVELAGGPAQTLCEAPLNRGGSWSQDGTIIFAPQYVGPLLRVSVGGLAPTQLTTLDQSRKETAHVWPHFLPDGRHFLYLARGAQRENNGIVVGSLDSKESKFLVQADSNVAYSSGYLIYLREHTLLVQPFDAEKLEVRGDPVPLVEPVLRNPSVAQGAFSVSNNGVLAYRGGVAANTQLVWFDREGKQLGTLGVPDTSASVLRLSPDEKRVAVTRIDPQTGTQDIWLLDLARGTSTRFTFDAANDNNPVWSADGSRIAFRSNRRDGHDDIYQKQTSGVGNEEVLVQSNEPKVAGDFSPDGRFFLYNVLKGPTDFDMWLLPLEGGRAPEIFLQTNFAELVGQFSPDGRWLAYMSRESGQWEVYVQSFPGLGGKWQVSNSGGATPKWRRDGRELFYVGSDGKLQAVEVKGDSATFVASVPKPLFDLKIVGGFPGIDRYAVTGDGQRFLVNTMLEESSAVPFTVVLNWTADLKR